jgi:hypothetical protein
MTEDAPLEALPALTRDLVPALRRMYPLETLKDLVVSDESSQTVQRFIGKLELIDELEATLEAEAEEAEENARAAQL